VGALAVARKSKKRVYALGGITPERAQMCADAGAHGVAVIRALLAAEDPAAVALDLAKPFTRPEERV
jgi:thiamine-phosphate pyrophosphorylase